jgi:hypothetical protein
MIIRNKFNGYSGDGRRLYPGGDSAPTQPTSTTQTTTSIPEYAKPYVERMLGKTEALTQSPYQTYGGERIAGFTPLQQQAFQGVSNLQPSRQLGAATQIGGMAGLGGLQAGQQYAQQATDPYAMQAYMSPFTNLALEPQLREASRRSAIEGQTQQAQAVRAGAFGGARQGIVEAERQRNLAQQQQDIYGRGMQTAFEQARQAQQFGSTLGLQGLSQAQQAASILGQLGQTQFGQQKDILQGQLAAGAQQRDLEQQRLQQAYQDFQAQRQHPYQQLGFMSDMLRGLPLGQYSQTMYQQPPSLLGQVAGAGLTYAGAKQAGLFAEGGVVPSGLAGIAADKLMQG